MRFVDRRSEQSYTQFKSEYTVYFGRRFHGVPIVGPALMARLDAAGKLVGLTKSWRDIGQTGVVFDAVEEPSELPEYSVQTCGYLEGPAIAYRQKAPGIGCIYFLEHERGADILSSLTATTVSFSDNPDLDPLGDPLFGEKGVREQMK